jgi:hypothetical protein
VQVELARVGDLGRAGRQDDPVGEARLGQQPQQRVPVVHPQVMPRPDQRPPRPRPKPGGPVEAHVGAGHEPVRVPGGDVAGDQPGQVRGSQPDDAAGPQHPHHLGQKRARLAAVEMLDHVRAVHRASRPRGTRNARRGVSETDISGPRHGDQVRGSRAEEKRAREHRVNSGPAGHANAE